MSIAEKMRMGAAGAGAGDSVEIYGVTDTQAFATHLSTSVSATQNLGLAFSDREIWVVVSTMGNSTSDATASAVTVNGNAATKVFEIAASGYTNSLGVSYWRYTDNGSLGGAATVAATWVQAQVHSGFVTFTAQSASNLLDSYGDSTNSTTPVPSAISTSSKGWAFYCAMSQNAPSGATIATFGNNGSFDAGTNEWVVYGFNSPEDNGTVLIDNPSAAGTLNRIISGISVEAS